MPEMNYAKLQGRIKEYGYTQKSIAQKVHMSESQFCQKLLGKYPFKQTQILDLCTALEIPAEQIGVYFFSPKS